MPDRVRLQAVAPLRQCEASGLIQFPGPLSVALARMDRLIERRAELRVPIDQSAAFDALVARTFGAAGTAGGRFPGVGELVRTESAEHERQIALRATETAQAQAAEALTGVLDATAEDLVRRLDQRLQSILSEPTVSAADQVPVGEDPVKLLRAGDETARNYNVLVAAVDQILALSGAWAALIRRHLRPAAAPESYCSVVTLPEGMAAIWTRPVVSRQSDRAPWGRESDELSKWHFLIVRRVPLALRTAGELDRDWQLWQDAQRAERVRAAG